MRDRPYRLITIVNRHDKPWIDGWPPARFSVKARAPVRLVPEFDRPPPTSFFWFRIRQFSAASTLHFDYLILCPSDS